MRDESLPSIGFGLSSLRSPDDGKREGSGILVLGLGNPILGDDAVGIFVAREIKRLAGERTGVTVKEASVGGFDLLDLLEGYRGAVIIDAIKTAGGRPG